MADIPDNNNAPDPSQVAPQDPNASPNLPQQTPAMPTQAPQAPVTPAASPSGAPNTPAAQGAVAPTPAQPQTPAQKHASIFHSVFSMLGGGGNRPQYEPNTLPDGSANPRAGQPMTNPDGTVKMGQASTKQLGMGILAGAVAGMMAGIATPRQFTQLPGGRMIEDFSGAAAAGAQAGSAFSPSGQRALAQKQADAAQTRQFATMDHNLRFHAMSLANDKADREYQEGTVAEHQSMNDAMDQAYAEGNVVDAQGNPIQLYKAQNILGQAVKKLLMDKSIGFTQDMVTPVGVVDVPNANGDGRTHPETLFSVYNPQAMVSMSDALRKDNPKLTNVPNGQAVPVRLLATWALNRTNERGAVDTLGDHITGYNAANPDAKIPEDFSLKAAAASNPLISKIYPYVTKYRNYPMDVMFDDIAKDPAVKDNQGLQAASAALQKAMGIRPENLTAMVEARKQGMKGTDFAPANPVEVAGLASQLRKDYTPAELTDAQINRLVAGLGSKPNQKAFREANQKAQTWSEQNTKDMNTADKTDSANKAKMWDTGTNPSTGEKLSLGNAPDSMLVEENTGLPIAFKQTAALKPSQMESNRADFANSTVHILDRIDALKQSGHLPNGPMNAWTQEGLLKAGLSSEDATAAMNLIGLAQSATTGAHVGGRFNQQIMDKMSKMIALKMDDAALQGAEDSIRFVMNGYRASGGRLTVGEVNQRRAAGEKMPWETGNASQTYIGGQSAPKVNKQGTPNAASGRTPSQYDQFGPVVK